MQLQAAGPTPAPQSLACQCKPCQLFSVGRAGVSGKPQPRPLPGAPFQQPHHIPRRPRESGRSDAVSTLVWQPGSCVTRSPAGRRVPPPGTRPLGPGSPVDPRWLHAKSAQEIHWASPQTPSLSSGLTRALPIAARTSPCLCLQKRHSLLQANSSSPASQGPPEPTDLAKLSPTLPCGFGTQTTAGLEWHSEARPCSPDCCSQQPQALHFFQNPVNWHSFHLPRGGAAYPVCPGLSGLAHVSCVIRKVPLSLSAPLRMTTQSVTLPRGS